MASVCCSMEEGDNMTTITSRSLADNICRLYPVVDDTVTPLPRQWSAKDKSSILGLSQNNLVVHYKGLLCWLLINRFFSDMGGCFICVVFSAAAVVKLVKHVAIVIQYSPFLDPWTEMCGSWNFWVRVSPQILTKDPLSVCVHNERNIGSASVRVRTE